MNVRNPTVTRSPQPYINKRGAFCVTWCALRVIAREKLSLLHFANLHRNNHHHPSPGFDKRLAIPQPHATAMYRAALPPPLTASAREARFAFYCTLCSKGYSRVHEFEAHENSYDHQHKKRFLEMKALQKKPMSTPSRSEGAASGIKPISLPAAESGGVKKKKGGFKSAFGTGAVRVEGAGGGEDKKKEAEVKKNEDDGRRVESDTEDEDGEERYDPAAPTGI
ncbi:hypothetical protein FN846DRAFT_940969 [Sphaerosporella brunnea]|uniref:C2H2-type domain-containing protein n=1 Tax=Sphaerosporella brunnea TaxID=1250544 RepID=A0A5J5F2I9_9PEZI|nr:hypothetical protein FN846DRAFT_940969 [Sphaerosporella brunnea]